MDGRVGVLALQIRVLLDLGGGGASLLFLQRGAVVVREDDPAVADEALVVEIRSLAVLLEEGGLFLGFTDHENEHGDGHNNNV